tara:strand:+ start:135 stop:353 length:219 start_codon:yes stop_codon:yes gene_type:complete
MRKVVEQDRSFIKDTTTQAIVNSDKKGYFAYMQRVTQKNKESDKLREMIRDINTLKAELREVKSLITKVLEK